MSTPGASPPAGERRPPSVAIDDLAAPRFTEPVAEMLRAVEPMAAGLSFSFDAVLGRRPARYGAVKVAGPWSVCPDYADDCGNMLRE